jgi:hypothetical protein
MNTKTMIQEIMCDFYDVSYSGLLPPEFKSWKEFYTYQAEKLGAIESALFPEGE